MDLKSQLEASGGAPAPDRDEPVVIDSPTPEAAPEAKADAPVVIPSGEVTEQTPAYTPSYKFKYTGKKDDKWGDAEGEIDEAIRPLIKSKEDEEKWQKLYSKAYGMDFIQDGRDKARNEHTQFREQVNPVLHLAQTINKQLSEGDLEGAIEALGIKYNDIQSMVFKRLQLEDLQKSNPNQYQAMAQAQQLTRQNRSYEEKLNAIQQENLQIQQTMHQNELSQEYQKPEVSSFIQSFETANGKDSFYQELQIRAQFIQDSQNRIPRPGEVISDVLSKFRFAQQAPVAPTQQAAVSPTVQPVLQATQKPVIPVLSGGGQSPSSKTFKSLKDIKTHRESL